MLLKCGLAAVIAIVTGGLMSSDRLTAPFDASNIAQYRRAVTSRPHGGVDDHVPPAFAPVDDSAKQRRRKRQPRRPKDDGADSPVAPRRRRATHGAAGCEAHLVSGIPPPARSGLAIVAPGSETTNQSHSAEYLVDAPPGTEATVDLCHNGHFLSRFNVARRLAEFAAYKLTPAGVSGPSFDRPRFLPSDGLPRELQPNAHASWGSGQSRGHLCPKSALLSSMSSQDATFDFTNVVPQVLSCNSGAWAAMERALVRWVLRTGRELYVQTGVVLHAAEGDSGAASFETLTALNITVPEYIWTVFCDAEGRESGGFYGKANQDGCGSLHATHRLRPGSEIEHLYGGRGGRVALFPHGVCNTDTASEAHWKFVFK